MDFIFPYLKSYGRAHPDTILYFNNILIFLSFSTIVYIKNIKFGKVNGLL